MDGNNRWAKQRGLSGIAGHEAGAERIREVLRSARKHNIDIVSLFAFSSENWSRPEAEVRGLMSLFATYLKKEARTLREDGIRLRVVGNRNQFSERLKKLISEAEASTASGKFTLVLYVDYGGRWEIARAARRAAEEVQSGRLRPSDIDEALLGRYLQLPELPAPDLCIRTAGEQRISNFLLWQLAYAELYFTNCYWPDFDETNFTRAVEEYYNRQRRFGQRNEQLTEENSLPRRGQSHA